MLGGDLASCQLSQCLFYARRYDGYAPPAAYQAADPYRAPSQGATAPYTTPAAPAAAAATYQAADTAAAAAAPAAAGGQQMMYILQDGVLKPLTVMYQQGATTAAGAAPAAAGYGTATAAGYSTTTAAGYGTATATPAVAQTAVLQTGYAAAPAASYGTAAPAQPSSTGATGMYQQAAATGATQYTYAVPSTDASGQQTWAVQQLGGQVAAATSAPLATAPATYTTAAGYGVSAGAFLSASAAAINVLLLACVSSGVRLRLPLMLHRNHLRQPRDGWWWRGASVSLMLVWRVARCCVLCPCADSGRHTVCCSTHNAVLLPASVSLQLLELYSRGWEGQVRCHTSTHSVALCCCSSTPAAAKPTRALITHPHQPAHG